MKSHSSSKHNSLSSNMEVEKPNLKEERHLSGAYIRSLVKQLSSSRPKDNTNRKPPNGVATHDVKCLGEQRHQSPPPPPPPPPPPQPQPSKKQVRRRLHTSRPYQERLLNMAEARREIVTALKFHRAAMQKANEQLQQQQQQQQNPTPRPTLQPTPLHLEEPNQELVDHSRKPRIHSPNHTFPSYLHNPPPRPLTYPSPFSWAYPSLGSLPISDNLNLMLPNQPLGLNLNLQGFNNIDTSFCSNLQDNKPPIQPSPSSSSSSYSSPPNMSSLQVPPISAAPTQASEAAASDPASMQLHPVMDEEEMAKLRSIGEQHDMEWNDAVNLVTSAWWSKFLNNMEAGPEERAEGKGGDGGQVFDEALEIPDWLNDCYGGDTSEGYLLQQHLDSYYHAADYMADASLPCLDIGEIEGWDGEWLS